MDKICLKGVFSVWNRKREDHHWILHTRLSLDTKFQLKQTVLIFWTKFSQKGYFLSKTEKIEYHHWVLHIRISLGTKFQLKQIVVNIGTKFSQKGYFLSKPEKVNTTTEFCIFELVWVPNFTWNKQFWILGPNLPKRIFPAENGKVALLRASMVVTYYIKLFRTGADRHNGILMSHLLLVAETKMDVMSCWLFLIILIGFLKQICKKSTQAYFRRCYLF